MHIAHVLFISDTPEFTVYFILVNIQYVRSYVVL